ARGGAGIGAVFDGVMGVRRAGGGIAKAARRPAIPNIFENVRSTTTFLPARTRSTPRGSSHRWMYASSRSTTESRGAAATSAVIWARGVTVPVGLFGLQT